MDNFHTKRAAILFIILIGVAAAATRTAKETTNEIDALIESLTDSHNRIVKPSAYRLSPFIIPLHYDVRLIANVKGWNHAGRSSIQGNAQIRINVLSNNATKILEIHSKLHSLHFVSLTHVDSSYAYKPIRTSYNSRKETTVWKFEAPLRRGHMVLKVNWTAFTSKEPIGVYDTWYNVNGTPHYALMTHGEPMFTRRWMACFDEPSMKATLNLTIVHPLRTVAKSNSPVAQTQTQFNMTETAFRTTKAISTYLYAFSITDYPQKSDIVDGIQLTVAVPHYRSRWLAYILKQASYALSGYRRALNATALGVEEIFEKMDIVFATDHASAMENVGHITSSAAYLINGRLSLMLAHEMAHQYFGNTVTLSWWDEVWINEALATMYEIDTVFEHESSLYRNQQRRRRNADMKADSLFGSRALKNQATSNVEASHNFLFAYNKGTTVLFMLRDYLSEEVWKRGIKKYLQKYRGKGVTGRQFLRVLADVAPMSKKGAVSRMGELLLEQAGFPLVRITRNGSTIEISQEKFTRGIVKGNERWLLPIHLFNPLTGWKQSIVLEGDKAIVHVDNQELVILDPQRIVYYRTVYDKKTYENVLQSNLTSDEKNELEADLLHAAHRGYVPIDFAYAFIGIRKNLKTLALLLADIQEIFTFDRKRADEIDAKFNERDESNEYHEHHQNAIAFECENVSTWQDAAMFYTHTAENPAIFFCPSLVNDSSFSLTQLIYNELNARSYLNESFLHVDHLKYITVQSSLRNDNVTADVLVKLSKDIKDDNRFAAIIQDVKFGLNCGHVNQIKAITKNRPEAARQNAMLFVSLLSEHKAVRREAALHGNEIEKAVDKYFKKEKDKNNTIPLYLEKRR